MQRGRRRGGILKREDLMLVAQLFGTMKELTKKLDEAYKKKNVEDLNSIKHEILELQRKVGEII